MPGRNEMYVWYVDENENDQGIWQTTDGGNTWTQLDDSGITNCGDFSGGGGTAQGIYNLELAAGSKGLPETQFYSGGNKNFKSTNRQLFSTVSRARAGRRMYT